MTRRFSFPLVLVVLGLFGGVAIGELALRALNAAGASWVRHDLDAELNIYVSHPFLNHSLTPELDVEVAAHSFPNIPAYHLRTNRLGFRFEMEQFASKATDTFRIAVLGDSQIEGYEEVYTLPELLKAELAAGPRRVEVMNFGVMSYSPILHYINLERNVLGFRPDLVVLHFDMTDVFDDSNRYRDITTWNADGNPVETNPGVEYGGLDANGKHSSTIQAGTAIALADLWSSSRNFQIFCMEYSLLFRQIAFAMLDPVAIRKMYVKPYYEKHTTEVERARHIDLRKIHEWCQKPDSPSVQRQVQFALSNLRRIDELLARHGVPWVLVTVPLRAQLVAPDGGVVLSGKPIETLEIFAREAAVAFETPGDELRAAIVAGKEVYFSDGMHLNYEGQRIWAQTLAPQVASFMERGH